MTQYMYIASPMRLPNGSFGSKPLSSEQPNVFINELDFIGLYFDNNYDSRLKRKISYSPHFSFDYQVAAYSNHIPLGLEYKGTAEEVKCLTILYAYLNEALNASGVVEYFTCLSGKEHSALSNKRNMCWVDIKDPYDLVLEDLEFWVITL
ncbi:hypothetical protein [Peribacillus muralis]|uniref:hypothetical protein n=1 Tax=Peribacillus muralis TaxID=264697 RepID=UPI000708FAA7|nr:hypothetical protein [Peribacillus muralis]